MAYIDIHGSRTHKLLFRYDPERGIIRIKVRDTIEVVELTSYRAPERGEAAQRAPSSPPTDTPPKTDERP